MPRRAAAVEAAKNISNIEEDENEIDNATGLDFQQNDENIEEMKDVDKITELCSITGSSKEEATNLLLACNGSLNMAIEMFTEDTENGKMNKSKPKPNNKSRSSKKNHDKDKLSKKVRDETLL